MTNKIPMTHNGAEQLRDELKHLKTKKRPEVIKAIAEARAHGDLRENAEYHAAKEQQGFIEGRIREIEGKLSHAHVIDITKLTCTGKVIFGTTVHLVNMETDEEVRYQIVGDDEADIKLGKVSVSSPIARALIGREEGESVVVTTPSGSIEFEIDSVLHV